MHQMTGQASDELTVEFSLRFLTARTKFLQNFNFSGPFFLKKAFQDSDTVHEEHECHVLECRGQEDALATMPGQTPTMPLTDTIWVSTSSAV